MLSVWQQRRGICIGSIFLRSSASVDLELNGDRWTYLIPDEPLRLHGCYYHVFHMASFDRDAVTHLFLLGAA